MKQDYPLGEYIEFDFNKMQLRIYEPTDNSVRIEYGIGENLIAFLNCDFSKYEEDRLYMLTKLNDKEFTTEAINKIKEAEEDNILHRVELELMGVSNEDFKTQLEARARFELLTRYEEIIPYNSLMSAGGALDEQMDFLEYQKGIKELIDFCYNLNNNELIANLSIHQRFLIYSSIGDYGQELSKYTFAAKVFSVADKETFPIFYKTKGWDMFNKKLDEKMIEKVKKLVVNTRENYIYEDPISTLNLELLKILKHNFVIKKCKNCNKYFMLVDNYNTAYCNNIFNEGNKTCREIGASRQYAKKIDADPILKAYNRAYKTHFARIIYKKMTKEEFNSWLMEAQSKRDITLKEFETAKNNSDEEKMSLITKEFEEWLKK